MSHSPIDDFCRNLILEAEHDCAESDPGMTDAAAMVLVGDVYALLVSRGETGKDSPHDAAREDDGLYPFIR